MTRLLVAPATLWRLFFAWIALTLLFGVVMRVWDFEIIDEISNPAAVIAHVDAMSSVQRAVHAWMTGTLDVVYPFVYGALFCGVAMRAFDRAGGALALLIAAVIPVDITEGVAQIAILNGAYEAAGLKAYLTPLKLGLFFLGLAVFIAGLVRMGLRARKAPAA